MLILNLSGFFVFAIFLLVDFQSNALFKKSGITPKRVQIRPKFSATVAFWEQEIKNDERYVKILRYDSDATTKVYDVIFGFLVYTKC